MRAFFRRLAAWPEPPLAPASIIIDGTALAVTFRRNARAKRLIVRLDRSGTGVVATVPDRISRTEALDFVERSRGWIAARLARQVAPANIAADNTVPLRGDVFALRATGGARGTIAVDTVARELVVPGDAAHVRRRLLDWLKAEARRDLATATARYCKRMGTSHRRLAIRDRKSRWGSCSAAGDLSYSWRLILAPPHVLDYVVAHEVAHLREMNHGPRFWRLVLTHCPHAATARTWLKQHGAEVHRFQ